MTSTAQPDEYAALFQDPTNFEELKRMPMADFAGLVEVWGQHRGEQGLGLVEILADSSQWTLAEFREWLENSGYERFEMIQATHVTKAIGVGDWVQYAVPKPPAATTYATGQVTEVTTTGTFTSGQDEVEGTSKDPAVRLRVWARVGPSEA